MAISVQALVKPLPMDADAFRVGATESPQHEVGPQDAQVNRNLGLMALAFAALAASGAVERLSAAGPPSFAAGIACSGTFTMVVTGLYLLWCWRFIVRHLDRPTAYFRGFDAQHLAISNIAFFGVGPFLGALAVITFIGDVTFVSGLLAAPAGFLLLLALGRLTGAIRPL